MMVRVIVSVGTNIDPERNLNKCRAILDTEVGILGEAEVIQTAPDGYQNQPDFLNGAYLLSTDRPYDEFNQYLKNVEERLGRVKGPIKSGPRCIDLDIIIWDSQVVHDDYTQNKHYVVVPVNELLEQHAIELAT
ncbi:2-amino-4-hydroxy-6-hydroxymethyldihydropteridine diphosphokinase [Ketobacter sp. MCCC 1A13808]|uniref:2-amino-4-hydroxy-6- hydroxymethyldihydropteridine diphosphokinase n=1 Tax=Ketobacter sp. MCCC 1A13808 TaxID=2602738 RepID=UPI000F2889EC|nr:2-amino-4-hydroxy-6-hydroxymethyldihydropteridine diphosphokinase [Ketobacter sp. MCCC 1A13808]MVF13427.1 2-amino-4-hydroxy-6-hydroxymethyldihydropteridine diphosphokinase [Ketobacter sp. MCCC 1A13808]RLP52946.1 MAG: 2-amino-4-hydroxy-6-hydroxymethyldihydropteridine diphosphokinase [Ketobacter sp.]